MIVLAFGAIGVLSSLWSVERVRRLGCLRLRHVWLVWSAFVAQIVLLEAMSGILPKWLGELFHLGTYALLVTFIVLNRNLPGALVIAAGTASNLIAITANGGTMPARAAAWTLAGRPPVPAGVFANSAALSDPKLLVLGDVFAVPAGWPLANVFSVGDVLIVAGATYLAHRWCAQPAETEWTVGDAERSLGAVHAAAGTHHTV